MIGTQLGQCQILERIGAGGMGEVYLARDQELDRRVALKVLAAHAADQCDRLERFRREARAVAGLNHPNIVTIFAIGEERGIHYFTMELVEGRPCKGARLRAREVRRIGRRGPSRRRRGRHARPDDGSRRAPRQISVHVAGTSAIRDRRHPFGHLCVRGTGLRDGDRHGRVSS